MAWRSAAQSRERTVVVGVRGDRLQTALSLVTLEKLLRQLPLRVYVDMEKKGAIRNEDMCQTFQAYLEEAGLGVQRA